MFWESWQRVWWVRVWQGGDWGCDQISHTDTRHCHTELETCLTLLAPVRPDKSNWWSHSLIVHCRPPVQLTQLMSALICGVRCGVTTGIPPPSPITSGGSGSAPPQLCPRGEPGKHIPDFWTVWPLPQGPTVTNWRDWQLAWPALSKLCIPKIRTPTISQSPAIQLLYFDFFLFHNKSYLASPGERSATLQQFLVFAWKSLTPKKEAFFLGDGYLELNIWNSNQSNENFVRS